MTDEIRLLLKLADVLNRGEVRYFISGSVASMHYGEARMTRDIDVVVHLRYGDIGTLLEAFQQPEFYLERLAILDALQHDGQFNAIQVPTGMKVDFMCAEASPYNKVRFERSRRVPFAPGIDIWFSAPEDVILKKLEYYKEGGSDKHSRDIASMIKVSGETFDREYLERWAAALGVVEEWNRIKARVGW